MERELEIGGLSENLDNLRSHVAVTSAHTSAEIAAIWLTIRFVLGLICVSLLLSFREDLWVIARYLWSLRK